MARPSAGAGIIYGKIHVYGGESTDECRQELFKILKTVGYPEQEREDDDEDFAEFDDEDSDDVAEESGRKAEDDELAKVEGERPWQKLVRKQKEQEDGAEK